MPEKAIETRNLQVPHRVFLAFITETRELNHPAIPRPCLLFWRAASTRKIKFAQFVPRIFTAPTRVIKDDLLEIELVAREKLLLNV